MKTIETDALRIAYLEDGPHDGWPVILSHGFPYDVHAFEQDAKLLAEMGARVIRPYVRGFGPTRFLSDAAMRNGQQVARALDIVQLADALRLDRPILGGFDWGANASCVVAALWPERIGGLVSYASYDIIDVAAQRRPAPPSLEHICWYQHLFQSERGRECLAEHWRALCAMLWRQWSPTWAFDAAVFDRSAVAFENPDFVDVVIHCYRFMLGHDDGDPALRRFEDRLATKPPIRVPTVAIDGTVDPLKPGGTADHDTLFAGPHERRTVEAGHAIPLEMPGMFADAVRTVRLWGDDRSGANTG
ncbi:MAG: alpha/beta hydrolase [Sphingomonas sp.]|nr:MAG: alpha/beta hydrolase [Sphingomonas sp.]